MIHRNPPPLPASQEVHGTGNIPAGYDNPLEPGWVEAARWVQRQAKLFNKGKLTVKRYAIIRDVVGAPWRVCCVLCCVYMHDHTHATACHVGFTVGVL